MFNGRSTDLCEGPMPLSCECSTNDRTDLLCRTRWTATRSKLVDAIEWRCESRWFVGPDVKHGAKCSGFPQPTTASKSTDASTAFAWEPGVHPKDGNLMFCRDCYDIPMRPAMPDTPCAGHINGHAEHGMWKCW